MSAVEHLGRQWDEITTQHPEMAEHEDAVNHFAHATPADPEAEGANVGSLTFHHADVDPSMIRYNASGVSDPRVTRARTGYMRGDPVPPVLLVKRGPKYDIADGHHRTEAAVGLQRGSMSSRYDTIPAVVTHRAVRTRLPEPI